VTGPRYELRFREWGTVFPGPRLVAAIVDGVGDGANHVPWR
jgi:hypothetical protein